MRESEPPDRPPTRLASKVGFVISAAVAALALRLAWDEPLVGVAVLIGVGALVLGRYLSRRRTQRLLRSGDVETIISRWGSSLRNVPHSQTMAPLMTATAFAAYGWVDRAREALQNAERGPAWEAALEHRLFVDTLLLTFEGDHSGALASADALERLPLPQAGTPLVARVRVLRGAVAALARAFSHRSERGDRRLLLEASDASPLVHWAMRYGAAVVSVDAGELGVAQALLQGAPAWPSESRFNQFHLEIAEELSRRLTPGSPPDASPASPPDAPPDASPADGHPPDARPAGTVVHEEDDPR